MELSFKVDNKMQTFKKDAIYFKDNIRAVQHTIVQDKFYKSDDPTPEMYEDMQHKFCEMIADLFNNEFSAEQFKAGMTLKNMKTAEEIFTLALGGKLDKEEKESEKK
jgi:hypothetical protein